MRKSKKIEPITTDEFIKANFPIITKNEPPTNSFTIEGLVSKTGLKRSTVSRRLQDLVDVGVLKKERYFRDGRYYNVYIQCQPE